MYITLIPARIKVVTYDTKAGLIILISHLQEAIFRVVAAILHLGNIVFAKGKDVDSSVLKDDQAKFHLNTTAELLMYVLLFFSFSHKGHFLGS